MGFRQRGFPLDGYGFVRNIVVSVILSAASLSLATDDPLGEPAMATAASPDSLTVSPQSLSSLTVGAQDPGALTAPTTALPAPVETQSPGGLVVQTESPSRLEGQTWNPEDLPEAASVESEVRQKVASQVAESQPRVASPDSLSAARSQLAASQARLERINSAIGTMLERDYPTGEARLRLYDEQGEARRQVKDSKSWVERLDPGDTGLSP